MSLSIDTAALPNVLLAEPDILLRRAVVKVAGELGLAHVHGAPDVHSAVLLMESQAFDAIIVALDREGNAMDLLTLLRCGQYLSAPSTPVTVLTGPGREGDAARLSSLGVRDRLQATCTARGVLDSLAILLQGPTLEPTGPEGHAHTSGGPGK